MATIMVVASRLLAPRPQLLPSRLQRPLDLLHPEGFNAVADLEIVEVLDANAAFETFADLPHVFLEQL